MIKTISSQREKVDLIYWCHIWKKINKGK